GGPAGPHRGAGAVGAVRVHRAVRGGGRDPDPGDDHGGRGRDDLRAPVGTVLSMAGVVLGCFGGYGLARALGRDTVMRMLGSHAEVIEERLHDGGFYAVCTLRLMPGIPYWPVNYGSGALGVRSREFLIATVV